MRLQLWYGVLLALALGAFGVTAYKFAWDDELQRIDEELIEHFQDRQKARTGPDGRRC